MDKDDLTDLPWHRRLSGVLWGLLGIIAALAIVEFLPAPRDTLFWDRAFDTGHIAIFVIVQLMILLAFRSAFQQRALKWQYIVSMMLSLTIGLLVEVWQMTNGRTAEWIDVYGDVIGILASAIAYANYDSRWNHRHPETEVSIARRRTLWGCVAVLIIVGVAPFGWTLDKYRIRREIFPQLIDFSQPWFLQFYHVKSGSFERIPMPSDWQGLPGFDSIGRIQLEPNTFSGFVMHEPSPNWSEFEYLCVEIFSHENQPRRWVMRIHDFQHQGHATDRFRKVFFLEPGFQTIRFRLDDVRSAPATREMNLHSIQAWQLYTYKLDKRVQIDLGQVYLQGN